MNKPRDPPGWGSNVSNLKEWEQLSEAENKASKGSQSKILGLKYLNLDGSETERAPESNQSETPSTASTDPQRAGRPRREKPAPKLKPVYSIEGKKNVAVGLDASKTEAAEEEEDPSEWEHACSRTSRRKFLKRQSKRQAQAAATAETTESIDATDAIEATEATEAGVQQPRKSFFEAEPEPPLVDEEEDENAEDFIEEGASGSEDDEEEDTRAFAAELAAHEAKESEELQTEGQEGNADGVASSTSEENLTTNPSWQSSIACTTGDFAMQNVILQMGLRLLSPSGIHVRELSRLASYFFSHVEYCRIPYWKWLKFY